MGAEQKYLKLLEQQIAEGSYRPDWASLAGAPVPDWFLREKLGIFLHWGLYSVPACTNEWYSRNMYIKGMPAYEHHRKTYGEQREFGYKDLIPLFRAIQTVIGGSAGKQIPDDGIVCFLPVMRRRIPGAGIGIQLIPYLRDDLEKLIFVDGLGEIGEYAVAYGGSGVIEIRVTA